MNKYNCINCNGNQEISCNTCLNKYSNVNFNLIINSLIEDKETMLKEKKIYFNF